jgi:hypothetical protein
MVGVNDIWIPAEPLEGDANSIGELAWRYSRVYRFGYMLMQWLRPPRLEIVGDEGPGREWTGPQDVRPDVVLQSLKKPVTAQYGGWDIRLGQSAGGRGGVSDLAANLGAIIEQARRDSIPVALLTYPSSAGPYGRTNERLRDFEQRSRTPLIDVNVRLAERCTPDCSDLLFSDGHPRSAGHSATARIVVDELRRENMLAQ